MLLKNNYIKIGKIKKKIDRNKGEYILYLSVKFDVFSMLDNILFIDVNNCDLLPVFPESYSEQSSNIIKIKFNEPSPEYNQNIYLNKDVYIPKELIGNENVTVTDLDITGWTVKDVNYGTVGTVSDIIDNKQQIILIVNNNSTPSNEIMIPLHQDLIIDSNLDNKTITFKLPDGLLNLNNN